MTIVERLLAVGLRLARGLERWLPVAVAVPVRCRPVRQRSPGARR